MSAKVACQCLLCGGVMSASNLGGVAGGSGKWLSGGWRLINGGNHQHQYQLASIMAAGS